MCAETPKEYPELINQFIPQTIFNLKKIGGYVFKSKNPAFYGSYDWHSSVHSHWQVIRAIRLFPNFPFVSNAIAVLDEHLTKENIEEELKNIPSGEVPYGVAWVLLLAQELHEWNNDSSSRFLDKVSTWRNAITPLELRARNEIKSYITYLSEPNRKGEHYQTALPLTLARDWAQVTGDTQLTNQIDRYSRKHYPIGIKKPIEPEGNDFLSPSLAEADLLRRVLKRDEFMAWLDGSYFPNGTYSFVKPSCDEPLSHKYGLCISTVRKRKYEKTNIFYDNKLKSYQNPEN